MREKFKYVVVVMMALVVSFGFASCSDDDDDDDNSIVGVWEFSNVTIRDLQTNNTANDGKIKGDLLANGKKKYEGTKLVFNYDGTAVINDSLVVPSYRYGYETLILKYGDGTLNDTLKVALVKNTLTLIEDYTGNYESMQLDQLINLGVTNPSDFKVSKAIVGVNYNRIKYAPK